MLRRKVYAEKEQTLTVDNDDRGDEEESEYELGSENGYDAKGKKIVNLRRRLGIWRRRKGNYECGKFSSVFPSENPQSDVTLVSSLPYEGDIVGSKTTRTNPTSGREVSLLDIKDAHMDQDMEERAFHSYEFGGPLVDTPPQDKSSSSTEIYMNLRVSEQPNGKSNFQLDDLRQRSSFSVETPESHLQADSSISMSKIAHLQSNHTMDQTCITIDDGEELKKNRHLKDQYHGNLRTSFLDTEPEVLDVHVIDDNIELRKDEVEKTNDFSFNAASEEPRDDDLTSGSLEVLNSIAVSNFPWASKAESDDGVGANINDVYVLVSYMILIKTCVCLASGFHLDP
ncbi:hypothetical protein K1719_029994 [Acacia pycnantha]|nr:hypothetical protein K1719_029994 [Acacia pycnantha]